VHTSEIGALRGIVFYCNVRIKFAAMLKRTRHTGAEAPVMVSSSGDLTQHRMLDLRLKVDDLTLLERRSPSFEKFSYQGMNYGQLSDRSTRVRYFCYAADSTCSYAAPRCVSFPCASRAEYLMQYAC
jgi:hypothetical protein